VLGFCIDRCAAGFALLNLPKGKSLGRSKPVTSSYAQALATHCVGFLLYPSSAELPYAKLYHRERILETSTLSCNEEEEEITKPPTR
jgi:hypothetical protein